MMPMRRHMSAMTLSSSLTTSVTTWWLIIGSTVHISIGLRNVFLPLIGRCENAARAMCVCFFQRWMRGKMTCSGCSGIATYPGWWSARTHDTTFQAPNTASFSMAARASVSACQVWIPVGECSPRSLLVRWRRLYMLGIQPHIMVQS